MGHLQYKNFPMKLQCKIRAGLRRVSRKGGRGGGGGGAWSTRALPQDGVNKRLPQDGANKRVENSYELDVDLNILAYIKQNCF